MPNRILRDWTDSEQVNNLSPGAERFFTRLIMKADDYGLFHGDAKKLRPLLFPWQLDRVSEANVAGWLVECEQQRLIVRYSVDGQNYLQIIKFRQRTDRSKPKFPVPSGWKDPHDGQAPVNCPAVTRQPPAQALSYSNANSTTTPKEAPHKPEPPEGVGGVGDFEVREELEAAGVKGGGLRQLLGIPDLSAAHVAIECAKIEKSGTAKNPPAVLVKNLRLPECRPPLIPPEDMKYLGHRVLAIGPHRVDGARLKSVKNSKGVPGVQWAPDVGAPASELVASSIVLKRRS